MIFFSSFQPGKVWKNNENATPSLFRWSGEVLLSPLLSSFPIAINEKELIFQSLPTSIFFSAEQLKLMHLLLFSVLLSRLCEGLVRNAELACTYQMG